MRCPNCGNEMKYSDCFCSKCGIPAAGLKTPLKAPYDEASEQKTEPEHSAGADFKIYSVGQVSHQAQMAEVPVKQMKSLTPTIDKLLRKFPPLEYSDKKKVLLLLVLAISGVLFLLLINPFNEELILSSFEPIPGTYVLIPLFTCVSLLIYCKKEVSFSLFAMNTVVLLISYTSIILFIQHIDDFFGENVPSELGLYVLAVFGFSFFLISLCTFVALTFTAKLMKINMFVANFLVSSTLIFIIILFGMV